ncbi:hypothetical protein TorRG33x02_191370 [Trema orientale]|uniref:Uncharacterized protein n=1 Tax=Trema orientale TaxID=63057 RepID=A0A2P5EHL8_TREOI|nr:hypothetical protein TorRG33x02_191370 [Trema orientale]
MPPSAFFRRNDGRQPLIFLTSSGCELYSPS